MRVPKKTVLPRGWGKMVLYHIRAKHLGAEWNPVGTILPCTILPQTIKKPFCPKASVN
jgi:hypothetical protein